MERIKEALAKARSNPGPAPEPRPVAAKAQQNGVEPVTPLTPGRPFVRTRSIMLDRMHLENNRIVTHDKSDPRSSYFDILRTRLLQEMLENDWSTLGITSPDPGCGKTVTSANLALSMAQQPGRTCILVDFDLRRPNVAKTLGLTMDRSLADYFHGMAELEDIVVNPELPGLLVLPNHTPVQNASEVLSSQTTTDLIDELKSRYPDAIILFDLPPVMAYDDVIAFMPSVDSMVMVAAVHQTKIPDIEECERRLQGTNYFGLVLNKVDDTFNKADGYYRY